MRDPEWVEAEETFRGAYARARKLHRVSLCMHVARSVIECVLLVLFVALLLAASPFKVLVMLAYPLLWVWELLLLFLAAQQRRTASRLITNEVTRVAGAEHVWIALEREGRGYQMSAAFFAGGFGALLKTMFVISFLIAFIKTPWGVFFALSLGVAALHARYMKSRRIARRLRRMHEIVVLRIERMLAL